MCCMFKIKGKVTYLIYIHLANNLSPKTTSFTALLNSIAPWPSNGILLGFYDFYVSFILISNVWYIVIFGSF